MRPVRVDLVTTEGGRAAMSNLRRKAVAADGMFSALVAEMNDAVRVAHGEAFTVPEVVPQWL